ncbi:MAG: HipA domain-containing protein [Alphaproteobacteria bacterium]|nr:HipA domain-containing protein [Alphaproteobacteria bacterium]
MTAPDRVTPGVRSLDIFLNHIKVGTLVSTPGHFNAFSFEPAYRAMERPPILSLSFRTAEGGLRKDPRPVARKLPAFFANLLPEGRLRQAMEKHHGDEVRPGNDFDLLAALGPDLPGAIRALPSDGFVAPASRQLLLPPRARFSLAGVQMKLSVMRNRSKGGLTLALGDAQGQYIAKFPSTTFPGVSENEFACTALAEAIGIEVPPRELVGCDQFDGIPEEFQTFAQGQVLLLRRFDRGEGDQRIHIEDFAQVFGLAPSRKYDGAACHDIALVLNAAVSPLAAIEFVRRLALSAIIGNGDMHLKNWSLIYPDDGTCPALAPLYDMLSTIAYIPADRFALSLGGEQAFKALTPARWKAFARRARLPEPAVVDAVRDTARHVDARWWTLPERDMVPPAVRERIDTHVRTMLSVLSG